jgi:hypothetical protein
MSKPFFCRSNLRASSSLVVLVLVVTLASIFTLRSAETLTVTGTMHPGVEAGCWLIRADGTGTDYLLIDAPDTLRVDGLHVQVTGEIKTDIASYCMQGSAALQVTSYSIFTGSTLQSTCTTTWTHTGGYLPVPSGVCQEIVPPDPILKALTDIWNWLRALLCDFGFCS